MTTRLHKEGRTIIPVALLIILGILAGAHFLLKGSVAYPLFYLLALGGIVLFGLVLNFFRNPVIDVAADDSKILSPCDGKVVVIEEVQDDIYFNGKVLQLISLFLASEEITQS